MAIMIVAAAAAVAQQPASRPAVSPRTSSAEPSATQPAGAVFTTGPSATCRVLPTPERIEPSHAPVNGQPSLEVPTRSGMILIEITQCRDIQAILSKYGLPGPATRYLDVAESDEMIANGATRWFRVAVAPGTESAIVVELYKHPEDIEYVQLIPEFTGGVAAG